MTRNKIIVSTLAFLTIIGGVAYGIGGYLDEDTIIVSSIMAPRDFGEMVENSDLVISGTVKDISIREKDSLRKDGEKDVVTTITIGIDDILFEKDEYRNDTIDINLLGGVTEKKTLIIENSPQYKVGSRVVSFVYREKDGSYWLGGGRQGKFDINEDGTLGSEDEKEFVKMVFGKESISFSEFEDGVRKERDSKLVE